MSWKTKQTNELFRAILALKSTDDAERFFRDLLTEAELTEFAHRWQAARLLDRDVPYREIIAQTGLSSRTVARIQKWLTSGMGGYQRMIDRLSHHASPVSGRG